MRAAVLSFCDLESASVRKPLSSDEAAATAPAGGFGTLLALYSQ